MGLSYNLADLFEAVADADPDRTAVLTSAGQRLSYAEMDARANRFAHVMQRLGVGPDDRVAVVARNRVEWLDALLGCFKIGALAVNVNYRYRAGEIGHVLRDAGPAAVVVEPEFADTLAECLPELSLRPAVLVLPGGGATGGTGADLLDYHAELAAASPERDFSPRSGDARYLLYTGGTTGLPRGVLWTHESLLFAALGGGGGLGEPIGAPAEVLRHLAQPPAPLLALAPLMHGNGQWAVLRAWTSGGAAVLWTGRRFDAEAILDLLADAEVAAVIVVGDAMARPLTDALRAQPRRWPLPHLTAFASGGAVLSPSVKSTLLEHCPQLSVIDGYGASETGSGNTMLGRTTGGMPIFQSGPRMAVLAEDLLPAPIGMPGLVAVPPPVALGYWRDPAKTAEVFRTGPDGTRWAVPGDQAVRNADGTITLLGRGSLAINTGGEKVFPDEVETVLKDHPDVLDAVVVGVPDDRLGEAVAAVVSGRPGTAVDPDALRRHARDSLAGYKIPRSVAVVDEVPRSPAGKADYRWARAVARTLKEDR